MSNIEYENEMKWKTYFIFEAKVGLESPLLHLNLYMSTGERCQGVTKFVVTV